MNHNFVGIIIILEVQNRLNCLTIILHRYSSDRNGVVHAQDAGSVHDWRDARWPSHHGQPVQDQRRREPDIERIPRPTVWNLHEEGQGERVERDTHRHQQGWYVRTAPLLPCYFVPSSRIRFLVISMTFFLRAFRSIAEPHSSESGYFVIALIPSSQRARGLSLFCVCRHSFPT